MSLLKHSIVKICTLKVSVLGLTLQVSVDLSYYIFCSWYQLKVQTRPTEKDFPCIFKSQSVICTLLFFFFYIYLHPINAITFSSFLNYCSHSFNGFCKHF